MHRFNLPEAHESAIARIHYQAFPEKRDPFFAIQEKCRFLGRNNRDKAVRQQNTVFAFFPVVTHGAVTKY